MGREEYNKLFDLGIELRDEGTKFHEAIKIFEELYPIEVQPDKFNKCLLLGGLYNWTGDKQKACEMFKTGVGLNPDSELASLCLYLAYVDLDKSDQAIGELARFLNLHPANLYKDTLSELIGEINSDRLPKYKTKIFHLAEKNGISLRV